MTFNPTEYHFLYKEYPQFSQWALPKGILFNSRENDEDEFGEYDLTSKAYLLMKRLGQDYNRIMLMDSEERDKFFRMEMEVIKEENKQKGEK